MGAVAVGWAKAEPVGADDRALYERHLALGRHAGMTWMERNMDVRFDPRLLLEGAQTVISVAFSYRPAELKPGPVSSYALMRDYHDELRERLTTAAETLGAPYRVCVDSAPMRERYWALKCGIGVPACNGSVLIPGHGTMCFLGEVITTQSTQSTQSTLSTLRCRGCGGCVRGCPAGAIKPGGGVDARKCLSYLTIEHRGDYTPEQEELIRKCGVLFGCDRCQVVCPENRLAPVGEIAKLANIATLANYGQMSVRGAARLLKGTPMARSAAQIVRTAKLLNTKH